MRVQKKALVLTQPLGTNYGGIMQAYALQKAISSLNYKVKTDSCTRRSQIVRRLLGKGKRQVMNLLGREGHFDVARPDVRNVIACNTNEFIQKNIDIIDLFGYSNKPKKQLVKEFDAVIVGSDQVWRKAYSHIPTYMLNFVKNKDTKRIAYAASFGLDNIDEYSPRLVKKSAKLAKKFDAISVREDSGVKICAEKWGVKSVHLIDPTLLLDKSDYEKLIDDKKTDSKNVFVYILDSSKQKDDTVEKVSKELKIKKTIFKINKPTSMKAFYKSPNDFIMPSVSEWLAGFRDASFVVTDSFHGCAFSIIFNKPFVAIGNKSRGMARFMSLLKMFGLEDRLVDDSKKFDASLVHAPINWQEVNGIITKERARSFGFLKSNLGFTKK